MLMSNASTKSSDCSVEVCTSCPARCCRTAGLGYKYLYLQPGEARMPLFRNVAKLRTDGLYVIRYENGACPFLGKNNRCTIYERRPEVCREYECWHPQHIEGGWKNKKHHRSLLLRFGKITSDRLRSTGEGAPS